MSDIHYANPDETTFTGATFEFRFGAYGETIVRVIQRPDCVDDALETAAEWLAEHEPGHFVEPDYAAAVQERNCDCCRSEPGTCDGCAAHAEADLTYTDSGWLPSWEWTVDELEGEPFETPHFDRFDIAEAYGCYWNAYHQGQGSTGYQRLCAAMRVLGGKLEDSFERLTDNGRAIYRGLVLADGR